MNNDKKNFKLSVLPCDPYCYYISDKIDRHLNEIDENKIAENIKFILFFTMILERIHKRFGIFSIHVVKRVYDIITSSSKVFVFIKENKTFHILVQNKISIFIEIASINKINIYSIYT